MGKNKQSFEIWVLWSAYRELHFQFFLQPKECGHIMPNFLDVRIWSTKHSQFLWLSGFLMPLWSRPLIQVVYVACVAFLHRSWFSCSLQKPVRTSMYSFNLLKYSGSTRIAPSAEREGEVASWSENHWVWIRQGLIPGKMLTFLLFNWPHCSAWSCLACLLLPCSHSLLSLFPPWDSLANGLHRVQIIHEASFPRYKESWCGTTCWVSLSYLWMNSPEAQSSARGDLEGCVCLSPLHFHLLSGTRFSYLPTGASLRKHSVGCKIRKRKGVGRLGKRREKKGKFGEQKKIPRIRIGSKSMR